jgi:hypothetical protein
VLKVSARLMFYPCRSDFTTFLPVLLQQQTAVVL